MEKEFYGLLGIILGILLKALFDLIKMQRQHSHEQNLNVDPAEENVKTLLLEMLNHKTHIDRTLEALKAKIAGYSDDEIRKVLMAIGAQKVRGREDGKERYYLNSRKEERNQKLESSRA